MRYSDKDKDNALAAYYNGAGYTDSDLTAILKADGYIATLTSPNGIVTRITDSGIAFYTNGGYVGAKAERDRKSRRDFRRNNCGYNRFIEWRDIRFSRWNIG